MDFVRFADPSHPGVNQWAAHINAEAALAAPPVPSCALAALVARESGGRNVLQDGADPKTGLLPDGTTAGVGLCQITSGVDWSNPLDPTRDGYHLFKPDENLYVAAAYFLGPAIKHATYLKAEYPTAFGLFGGGQLLYYAFCAYNAGDGSVEKALRAGHDPDDFTTNHYGAGTMAFYLAFVAASHGAT